jgi:hypothetical protein
MNKFFELNYLIYFLIKLVNLYMFMQYILIIMQDNYSIKN